MLNESSGLYSPLLGLKVMDADQSLLAKRHHMEVLPGPFLVIASITWPFIFCAVTFSLFFIYHPYATDRVRTVEQIPTISGTGQLLPERLIFTYGLHLEALFLALLFALIYANFEQTINAISISESDLNELEPFEERDIERASPEPVKSNGAAWGFLLCGCFISVQTRRKSREYMLFWNKVLLGLVLTAAFFMSLVGTVTLGVSEPVHTGLAAVMFISAALHLVLFYFTLADAVGTSYSQYVLHTVCLVVVIPFNIVMIIVLSVMWVYCTSHTCLAAAVDLIVVLEYTTAVALLAYLFRFYDVVQHSSIGSLLPALPVDAEPGQLAAGDSLRISSPGQDPEDVLELESGPTEAAIQVGEGAPHSGESMVPFSPPRRRRHKASIPNPHGGGGEVGAVPGIGVPAQVVGVEEAKKIV